MMKRKRSEEKADTTSSHLISCSRLKNRLATDRYEPLFTKYILSFSREDKVYENLCCSGWLHCRQVEEGSHHAIVVLYYVLYGWNYMVYGEGLNFLINDAE